MLAKGHHLRNLTLVAIIDADSGLFSTDFRATEHMGQLLMQVAGRAGREEKKGEVIIQTHHPEHPLLKLLLEKGYLAFAESLLAERKIAALPPYAYLAILRAEAKEPELAQNFLNNVKSWFFEQKVNSINLWGPATALMPRKAGRYRFQLLFQTHQRSNLQKLLKTLSREIPVFKGSSQVRFSLDVDPIDIT